MRRLLIDGKLVETGRTFPSFNPATGAVVGEAAAATTSEAEAAVGAARHAFDTTSWSTDVAERIRCLNQLHEALTEHREELRELTIAEVGAPRMLTHGPQLDEPVGLVLLSGVDPDSEIAQDEVFGPVLAVIPHDGDDGAVRIANNSIFGLSGGVYSRDEQRAIAVARRIRTGTIGVNGGNFFAADAPFGGYKQSGIGREMGVAGLEEFQERKTIAVAVA